MNARLRLFTAGLVLAILWAIPSRSEPLLPNPWLDRRPLNIAHQGGENEAPSNTMYAFKRAKALGADVLELDVHATADRQIVVQHDATVDRTTGGTGRVDSMTLDQIRTLDAAYWFTPEEGTCHDAGCPHPFRGVAIAEVAPPAGYSADDFKIPTLAEVLETFHSDLINIEIKASAPDTIPYEKELADLLAEYKRDDDVIVVSFLDNATEIFKAWAPSVHTATGTGETALFWASAQNALPGAPNPRYVALQVPVVFMGVTVVNQDFVSNAQANGLAVHVWTIDNFGEMCTLLDYGVEGIMTNFPTVLEGILKGSTPCP